MGCATPSSLSSLSLFALWRQSRTLAVALVVNKLGSNGVVVEHSASEGDSSNKLSTTYSNVVSSILRSLKDTCADVGLYACADECIPSLKEWVSTTQLELRLLYRDVLARHAQFIGLELASAVASGRFEPP